MTEFVLNYFPGYVMSCIVAKDYHADTRLHYIIVMKLIFPVMSWFSLQIQLVQIKYVVASSAATGNLRKTSA